MKFNQILFTEAALAGFATLWFVENVLGMSITHHAGGGATGFHAGCAPNADPGRSNPSPGWYTEGANSSGGAGWTGTAGHHHCNWQDKCCFCTDVKKCIASKTPPTRPGDCRPDWGTSGYLGGGQYPKTADFSACPAGTAPQ